MTSTMRKPASHHAEIPPLTDECTRQGPGCTGKRLPYGPYCGPCDPVWTPPSPTRCQRPLRCYCPAPTCLGHPDNKVDRRVTPMPAELRAMADELAQRRRDRVIARARGRAL